MSKINWVSAQINETLQVFRISVLLQLVNLNKGDIFFKKVILIIKTIKNIINNWGLYSSLRRHDQVKMQYTLHFYRHYFDVDAC